MLPIKKILFPTDFSEPSYEALKAADELASHFSAELVLIHVVSPVPMYPTPMTPSDFTSSIGFVTSYQQEMEVYAKESLDQVVQERVSKGIKSRTRVCLGDAADEIVGTATDENADLIVIATHGLTGWRRFMFGSVAEKVVRLAQCPVLTIREPEGKE
ncbi:MAG TPA: universal stress protein [Desulfatiglandales bacterium]|nr:universal stress protein [Desulfatiglandales bacterium]